MGGSITPQRAILVLHDEFLSLAFKNRKFLLVNCYWTSVGCAPVVQPSTCFDSCSICIIDIRLEGLCELMGCSRSSEGGAGSFTLLRSPKPGYEARIASFRGV